MSISVDDLVASFGSNHIGQEACDLAALQSQLAQTLFAAALPNQQAAPHRDIGYSQPSNTPMACTPSSPTSSFSWNNMMHASTGKRRSNSRASRVSMDDAYMAVDDEDERAVEDILAASSPIATSATPSPVSYHQGEQPSLFATTDPFFLAAQKPQAPAAPSFFAQAGRPAAHSPFLAQQPQHPRGRDAYPVFGHAHAQPKPHLDTRMVFAGAYDR